MIESIIEKRGPGRPPKQAEPETKQVRLLCNYMPVAGGNKRLPGEMLDLPVEEARRLVKAGIAERADEF